MKIYNVGSDELSDWDLNDLDGDKYEWIVYWYENGGYDGFGEAVALRKDGIVVVKDLSHCSCYGPMEDWEAGSSKVTMEELLREKDNVHDLEVKDAIETKIRELVA